MKAFKLSGVVTLTILVAMSFGAHAAVYKHVDEYGNVSYSDRPMEGANKVKIRGVSEEPTSDDDDDEEEGEGSAESRSTQQRGTGDSGDATPTKYKKLEILTPKPGKIVDEKSGSVQVIFLPTPSLGQSDILVVSFDGKEISKGRDANLSLSNLAPGTHTVTGKILDATGKAKITSSTVTFQVGQNAALAQGDD